MDETLRDQLEVQLHMLKREGLIETWHDRGIAAGEEVDPAIAAKLEESEVILLLVSPDFLASEYCWGIEVKRAMERHEEGEATVIPVILRHCEWQRATFGKLQAAPKDGRPIVSWPDRDEAFLDVTRMIRSAVEKRNRIVSTTPQRAFAHPTQSAPRVTQVRSSNLRVTKKFTQADEDAFLHATFEYVQKFFEESLHALAERNPNISGSFRPIDANRFTASAYRDGRKETACTIWIGGESYSRNSINYRSDDSGRTDSLNESLHVEADEQSLHLKALMGGAFGERDRKLTMQGAAERLWEKFMEPLQRRSR